MLLKLLRCALWNESFEGDISPKEFKQVLMLSEQQTVVGLVFNVLSDRKINIKQRVLMDCIAMSMEIERQNKLLNKEMREMAQAFDIVGLDFIVVKGQTIGCLYPKPQLRQSGDIDYFVHNDYRTAKKLTEEALGVKLPKKMVEKEVGFERNGIRYELHTSLRSFIGRKHQQVWNTLMEEEWESHHFVMIEGEKVRVLSPTVLVIYIFINLFFHFTREGVSLRQLCDWAISLHYYHNEIKQQCLNEIIENLGLKKAFCAFGAIAVDELGLHANEFPIELNDDDRKWKNKILADIFKGGNFGKLNHKEHSSWKYKLETMNISVRNSIKYFSLSPIEVGMMIPRLLRGNARIMLKKML